MPKRKTPTHNRLVKEDKILHKSRVCSPVKGAWQVFDDTKAKLGDKFTRKAAIDAALAKGIAFYTARTQYQEWKMAGDRDRANHIRLYGTQPKPKS